MDKGVRKIRARIKRRKETRFKTEGNERKGLPLMMSEEEKHGFAMPIEDISGKTPVFTKKKKQNGHVVRQVALSFILFIACAIVFKTSFIPFHGAKTFVEDALTEEFPFAKVHHWYVETLGAPLTLTPTVPTSTGENIASSAMPIPGEVVETFATNGKGIMISPNEETNVHAWKQGVVIFAGNDEVTNKTVLIQHPDGSKTTYGLLSTIDVHLYEFIETNEQVGTFEPKAEQEVAYLSIEKDKQFIDPSEVMRVDDVR